MKSYPSRTSFFVCLIFINLLGVTAKAEHYETYGGGSGTPNDPYLICDANHMNAIGGNRHDWGRHFKLMADIDLSGYMGTSFNIIGSDWSDAFEGVFDGNGHTISNFIYYSTSSEDYMLIGIFGFVRGTNARIKDLHLENVYIHLNTGQFIGGLVGNLEEGTAEGCSVQGAYIRVQNGGGIGGLIGHNYYGNIHNCHVEAEIIGKDIVGCLAGCSAWGTVTDSSAHGRVSATGWEAGGLVGGNVEESLISGCYANVSVYGQHSVGGLVGNVHVSKIVNSYSTGKVSGTEEVGGLVGHNVFGIINFCYSATEVEGTTWTGGLVGWGRCDSAISSYWDVDVSGIPYGLAGTGKTTEQMKSASTYTGWGCDGAWTIDDGNSYPKLAWQGLAGKAINDSLSDYLPGSGTANEPYLINSVEDFNMMSLFTCEWDKHFKLVDDINFPISYETNFNIMGLLGLEFTGVFDGNNHEIRNLLYLEPKQHAVGLFGYVSGASAEIKSLRLVEPQIINHDTYLGALVGILSDGTIDNCHIEGGGVGGGRVVGGLVAQNKGTITNCSSSASTSGESRIGGLVGHNRGLIEKSHAQANAHCNKSYSYVGGLAGENSGTINYCYSTGRLWSSLMHNVMTGGLVGAGGTISNSYSHARVERGGGGGVSYSGGLAGRRATIINSYSTGQVVGEGNEGGLMGGGGIAYDCFWDVETSGRTVSAGGEGAVGKETDEMQELNTFINAGWDFDTPVWTIYEGQDYPRLWWENSAPVGCVLGGDRVVGADANCEARVVLDGSCSSDEDSTEGTNDDITDFEWYEIIDPCDANSDILLGSGEVIECNLPLGAHNIVLVVTDKACEFDSNEVIITLEDVTPPEFSLSVEPNVLWPVNHSMVEITPSWAVSDNCDEQPGVSLVSITIEDDGSSSDDILVDSNDSSIWVRAERSGAGTGRVYTITYQAVDDSNNVSVNSATVIVPHDRR